MSKFERLLLDFRNKALSKTLERAPDAQITFEPAAYVIALGYYHLAMGWIMRTGQAFNSNVVGILQHPAHPESPVGDYFVPALIKDDPRWTVTINLWALNPAGTETILSIEPPAGASITARKPPSADALCVDCSHTYKWHFDGDGLPSARTGCGVPACPCEVFKEE